MKLRIKRVQTRSTTVTPASRYSASLSTARASLAVPQRTGRVLAPNRRLPERPGFMLRPMRQEGLLIAMPLPGTKLADEPIAHAIPTQDLPAAAASPVMPVQGFPRRKKMALLLPGHNEELIIQATIRSAIAAGQDAADIYVVDDASTDNMYNLAVAELNIAQVLHVERSGKAVAVQKAIAHFNLAAQYEWVHVADADSIFSPRYFYEYKRKLDKGDYAVALGFVQSMRGNWISTYRALTYTYSQHVTRRVQSKLGMISVFPGPITAFRTDILPQLDFMSNSLTEDFDITLQVHRKKLGSIAFIPGAVNYTQDPQTLKDFWRQNLRWQRGFFQGVKKYRVGLQRQRIDLSLGWQMLQSLFFVVQLFVLIPLVVMLTGSWLSVAVMIAADIVINGVIALGSSVAVKRWNLLGALPYFYFLRWLEIAAYFAAFFEVMVLRKFQAEVKGWTTEGRRYKLSNAALADIAG